MTERYLRFFFLICYKVLQKGSQEQAEGFQYLLSIVQFIMKTRDQVSSNADLRDELYLKVLRY